MGNLLHARSLIKDRIKSMHMTTDMINILETSKLEQRARAFDYLFDAVVVTDLNGTIIDWNSGSEKLYGYSKQEALGRPVHTLNVAEDTPHLAIQIIQTVKITGKWNGEVQVLKKNGSTGWVECMMVPLFDDVNQMIGVLGINRDISDRRRKEEHLANLAHYDQLTGLPNRYLLMDRLSHLIQHSVREKTKFALLFIDLNNFKAVNDNDGHDQGDLVLKETAKKLKHSIRRSDTAARIGGDEFIVLLETIKNDSDALFMAENIIQTLYEPCVINKKIYTITGSVGTAIYPRDGTSSDALLSHADNAMYRVKKAVKDAAKP